MNKRNDGRNHFCCKDSLVEEGPGCENSSKMPVTEVSSEANSISHGNSEINDSDSKHLF